MKKQIRKIQVELNGESNLSKYEFETHNSINSMFWGVYYENSGSLSLPTETHLNTLNTIIKNTPMNRFGEAQEVADLVSFLASEKSSYITGEVININGGIYS